MPGQVAQDGQVLRPNWTRERAIPFDRPALGRENSIMVGRTTFVADVWIDPEVCNLHSTYTFEVECRGIILTFSGCKAKSSTPERGTHFDLREAPLMTFRMAA